MNSIVEDFSNNFFKFLKKLKRGQQQQKGNELIVLRITWKTLEALTTKNVYMYVKEKLTKTQNPTL